jgi:hypothetical protein
MSAHKAPASAIPPPIPQTLSLRFCAVCGRHDRFKNLSLRHYPLAPTANELGGRLCRGEIVVAVYRFDRVQRPKREEP